MDLTAPAPESAEMRLLAKAIWASFGGGRVGKSYGIP